jgi:hypothetical protein
MRNNPQRGRGKLVKTITAIFGDLHAGSSTAIATPKYTEHTGRGDETKITEANKIQTWLHTCWKDYWDYIKELAGVRGKSRKCRIVSVFLGEFVDGLHHGTTQALSEIEDQFALAIDLVQPAADLSDGGLFVTPGSEAHSGPAGQHDFRVANQLGAKLVDWQLVLDIDGLLIDCAHHDRASQSDWGSRAAGIAATVIMDCALRGAPIPRYIFRGHSHVVDDSGEKLPNTRAVCTPSWQLRTAYGYKVSSRKHRSDIGGLIINGKDLDFSRVRYCAPADTLTQGRVFHV